MAELTIGMPVYNNARTLAAALDSLLAQTFGDFRIILSDDASTDDTAALARRYAARDGRIAYIRQPKNLGYSGNYGFVAAQADTPFFMWACGDDRWAPRFIETNLRALKEDPSHVASVSQVEFVRGDETVGRAIGTYAIRGTTKQRLARYLARCGTIDASWLFGIYRADAVKSALPLVASFAFDLGFCAHALRYGGFHEIPEVLLFRDRTPIEHYTALMHKEAGSGLGAYFPGIKITRWLLFERRIPLDWRIVLALLTFNIEQHLTYMERYYPRYVSSMKPFWQLWDRQIGWRLRALCGGKIAA